MTNNVRKTVQSRSMSSGDIKTVLNIEKEVQKFPWSRGNFEDSLREGYICQVMEYGATIIGYGILMIGVRELHLLNLAISNAWQRQGYGKLLFESCMKVIENKQFDLCIVETQESNSRAVLFYKRLGFEQINIRKNYYSGTDGGVSAITLKLEI